MVGRAKDRARGPLRYGWEYWALTHPPLIFTGTHPQPCTTPNRRIHSPDEEASLCQQHRHMCTVFSAIIGSSGV